MRKRHSSLKNTWFTMVEKTSEIISRDMKPEEKGIDVCLYGVRLVSSFAETLLDPLPHYGGTYVSKRHREDPELAV